MIKKISLFILLFIPFFVNAIEVPSYSPNRYYGYYHSILEVNDDAVVLWYYNNGYVENEGQTDPLLSLASNSNHTFKYQVRTYGVCLSDSTNCLFSGLNDSDLHFWEQDICVSSNNFNIKVFNPQGQDFADNDNPSILVTDQMCKLYDTNNHPDIVGPAYWEWLGNYDGYVVKVFMPIYNWISTTINNQPVFQLASRITITNLNNHDFYYRFLDTGGLYDHSRYLKLDNSFDLDTKNFDLTLEAINDGVSVMDSNTSLVYQNSKNLFNKYGIQYLSGNASISILDTGIRATTLNAGTYRTAYIKLGGTELAGKTLTLSANITPSSTNNGRLFVRYGTTGPEETISGTNLDNTGKVTFTLPNEFPSNYTTLWLGFYSNVSGTETAGLYVDYTNLQIEIGSYATSYCPYGPTLDNNCVSHYVDNIITWDDSNMSNNIISILNLPFKLSEFFIAGSQGNCQPLSFILFNHQINVPCGSFFWAREDVQDFRNVWNLLFGGFIIFKLVLWDLRVFVSVLDPMGDSIGLGIDLFDVSGSRELRSSKLASIRRKDR